MGRTFDRWMHGNMRPIWGNLEGRWIFQVRYSYKKWTLLAIKNLAYLLYEYTKNVQSFKPPMKSIKRKAHEKTF